MSSLTILGDTSGSVVLDAPAVAGSNTITLPTTGGTMRTTRTPGAILQVIQAGSNGTSTSSTSFVDSGLTASITPTSSTNKILVTVNGVCRATNQRGGFALVRNSTQLFGYSEANGTGAQVPYSFTYLDSPATTSSTTYKLQIAVAGGGGTFGNNDAGVISSGNLNYITLMEVAA